MLEQCYRKKKSEIKRMKINTFGSEVSWQGAGKITTGTFKIFYTGGREHERGTTIIQDQDMGKTIE